MCAHDDVSAFTENHDATALHGDQRVVWDAIAAIACGMTLAHVCSRHNVSVEFEQGPGGPHHSYVNVRARGGQAHGFLELHDGQPMCIEIFAEPHSHAAAFEVML